MDFAFSEKSLRIQDALRAFIATHVAPREADYAQLEEAGVFPPPFLEELKAKARAEGLWNLFLPGLKPDEPGTQMSNLDYAPCAEIMGRHDWASEVFNCSAPDTGNMELLHLAATPAQQERWLKPLLDGAIRSSFAMTEPDVASSDATNISMRCERQGDDYVLNGEKWWASGAGDPRCAIYIVMVRTGSDEEPQHRRHSMILVPSASKGITKLRPMQVYGDDDAPHGHMHLRFDNVRVPAANLILGEGRGFEIAQGRLGPGRIHHCMRAIGQAEMALEMLCQRSVRREAFGQSLAKLGANFDIIAECRMEIEMARLLCLKAAWMIDQGDARAAAPWISQIKVVAPRVALKVTDERCRCSARKASVRIRRSPARGRI